MATLIQTGKDAVILKLIHCEVEAHSVEAFSTSQAEWKALADIPGFLLQTGGWVDNQEKASASLHACILALWSGQNSYENFRLYHHDDIVAANRQNQTYLSCFVELMELQEQNATDLLQRLSNSHRIQIQKFAPELRVIEIAADDLIQRIPLAKSPISTHMENDLPFSFNRLPSWTIST